MSFPTITKERAIVWLKMTIRACAIIVGSAAVLQMPEWMIFLTALVGQLAVERLNMFSQEVVVEAKHEPSNSQERRIAELEDLLVRRNLELSELRAKEDQKAFRQPDDVREQLADLAHEQWSGWMQYLFAKSAVNDDGSVSIPTELVERWQRQVSTPYADLPGHEQESDRVEADKVLRVLEGKTE